MRVLRLWASHYMYSGRCRRTDRLWQWGPSAATGAFVLKFGTQQMRQPYESRTRRKAKRDTEVSMGQQRGQGEATPCCVVDTQPRTLHGPSVAKLQYRCTNWPRRGAAARLAKLGHVPGADNTCGWLSTDVEEHVVLHAAWHFSYFKQPAEIVAKLASFAHPKTSAPYNDTKFHYAQAMRCSAPDHPDWRFEYLPRLVDVPSYVRLNRCRARSFYAYSQRRPTSGS